MTTAKDIEDQIDNDKLVYGNSVYDGELPQLFLDYFKIALMYVPPTGHRYDLLHVKAIIAKKSNDQFTITEVGMIINLIYAAPWSEMFTDVDEALDIFIGFLNIQNKYNKDSIEFDIKCMKKRMHLRKLAGLNRETSPLIITQ